jgi:hypothetical protein
MNFSNNVYDPSVNCLYTYCVSLIDLMVKSYFVFGEYFLKFYFHFQSEHKYNEIHSHQKLQLLAYYLVLLFDYFYYI